MMVRTERFGVFKKGLAEEFKAGKRWLIFDSESLPTSIPDCFYGYADALKEKSTGCIAELGYLLRLLNTAPRIPYQWGPAIPVTITKVIFPLTSIDHYRISICQKVLPHRFESFEEAWMNFSSSCGLTGERLLIGIWKAHPEKQYSVILYRFEGTGIVETINDPCQYILVPLTFFIKKHLRTGDIRFFDGFLRRVQNIQTGVYFEVDRFVQIEN
jgi:hypothetical protein